MNSLDQSSQALGTFAVLIPAWQPEIGLISLVRDLTSCGFGAVIVVDDGSKNDCCAVFEQIERMERTSPVRLLRHAVNLGKGRALKTGVNSFLNDMPGFEGLVTADADGQHKVADIRRVAEAMHSADGRAVLGTRKFLKGVPLRSRFGNNLTRGVFGFITGVRVADTQTGLRAFPREMLRDLMVLDGERYEYEMTVLAHICSHAGKPVEIPIETVYLDGNRSSHFNPLLDSMRIYFVLLRFCFSSLFAAGLDFAGFSLTFLLTGSLPVSVAVGRLSSLVNFMVNRRFVFQSDDGIRGSLVRYYLLVFVVAACSYGLLWGATTRLGWNVFASKIAADVVLSLFSFWAQRVFVFRRSAKPKPVELAKAA